MRVQSWVVLLRGVNVGGHNKVPMADLRDLIESFGFADVRTYLQSGNAILTSGEHEAAEIAERVASGIGSRLGLDITVVVRSGEELAAVVEANPFLARGAPLTELHVGFAASVLPVDALAALDRERFAPNEFEVAGREIYMRLPSGVQASRLPNWERLGRTAVTSRNWSTVTRLRALAVG